MIRRVVQILLLISVMPAALSGLAGGDLLCVGADGHVAMTLADACSEVSCAPIVGAWRHLPGGQSLSCRHDSSPCTDAPLLPWIEPPTGVGQQNVATPSLIHGTSALLGHRLALPGLAVCGRAGYPPDWVCANRGSAVSPVRLS